MKKFLAILLISVMVMSLTVNFSFADEISEDEKAEILDAASEAYKTFEYFTGYRLGDYNNNEFYNHGSKGSCVILKDANTSSEYGETYFRTYIEMTSADEYYDYLDKYFVNYNIPNSWIFVADEEEENFEYLDLPYSDAVDISYTGEEKGFPEAVIVNGYLYVKTHVGIAYTITYYSDVANGEVTWCDGNNAEVTFDVVDGEGGTDVLVDNVTVTLKKTAEGWKINGGTCFSADFVEGFGDNWFKNTNPSTGENTILYIAIAGAAVVCMTALLVRKKREIV